MKQRKLCALLAILMALTACAGKRPYGLFFLQRILYRTEINFPKQRKGNAGQADNQA